jgi:heme exporter protein D
MIWWKSAGDFLAMGGYGFYVWGSVLVTAGCMAAEPLLLAARRRRALQAARAERTRHETAA